MTKRNLSLGAAALFILPLVGVLLFSGCETESVTQTDIKVEPNYAGLPVGQSMTLTASGWNNYRWSLSESSIGHLSAYTGRSVVYTATAGRGSTQTITATADASVSTTESSTSSSTNGVPSTTTTTPYSGAARIIHQ